MSEYIDLINDFVFGQIKTALTIVIGVFLSRGNSQSSPYLLYGGGHTYDMRRVHVGSAPSLWIFSKI
jgi:hypothetical protein